MNIKESIAAVLILLIMVGMIYMVVNEETTTTSITENKIKYTQDQKTGLCFAVYTAHYKYGLAEVDCNKVTKYLD